MSAEFIEFCRAHGVIIDHTPPVGRWCRYKTTDKPKRRNGAVKYLGDVGFVQNHALQTGVAIWRADRPSDPIEQQRRRSEQRQLRSAEARQQAQAIWNARKVFQRCAPLRGGHPYLEAKGLTMDGCAGLRVGTVEDVRSLMQWDRNYEDDDATILMVPAYKGTNLVSVQMIWPDGRKLYARYCPMQGATFMLRRPGAAITAHCEGLATGLAVFQSVPLANVVVYFDLGNMVRTAPTLDITGMQVVCADNDHATYEKMRIAHEADPTKRPPENPGIKYGTPVAKELGCGLAYPPEMEGVSDFADLRQRLCEKGASAVRDLVMRNARVVFKR